MPQMLVHRLAAEFVTLQAVAAATGGRVTGTGRRVADALDDPFARRHLPVQCSVRHPSWPSDQSPRRAARWHRSVRETPARRCRDRIPDIGPAVREYRSLFAVSRWYPGAAIPLKRRRAGPQSDSSTTSFCIDSSGVIHGPLLPHQPGPLVMLISSPSRAASCNGKLKQLSPFRIHEFRRPARRCVSVPAHP